MSNGKAYFTERERRKVRSTAVQIRYLVDYMAAHSHLATSEFPPGTKKHDEEWAKLKTVLKEYGPDRSTDQWKSSWRDLKRKAKDERRKFKQVVLQKRKHEAVPELSQQSRTILDAIGYESPDEMKVLTLDTSVEATWENSAATMQTDNMNDEEERRNTSSSNDTMKTPITEDPLEYEGGGEPAPLDQDQDILEESVACFTEGFQTAPTESTKRYQLRQSVSSVSSGSSSKQSKKKKKNHTVIRDKDRDITETLNKFIEYEREKERLAHEREMSRIGQNEKVVHLLEKVVNILDSIAPGIKLYMDQNRNHIGDK